MILCWGEGHGSAIHDHAESHCFMKMLQGELREIRYAWPNDNNNDNYNSNNMNSNYNIDSDASVDISEQKQDTHYDGNVLKEISRSIMETNSVHYINGSIYIKY